MCVNPNTIILVENDIQTVALLQHILCRKCVNVVSITSKELHQLNTLIQNHQPTLVIFDYMSIRYYYADTCNMLHSTLFRIPTVLLTSINTNTMSASFDYIIKKPFYTSDIFMVMQDVLEKST